MPTHPALGALLHHATTRPLDRAICDGPVAWRWCDLAQAASTLAARLGASPSDVPRRGTAAAGATHDTASAGFLERAHRTEEAHAPEAAPPKPSQHLTPHGWSPLHAPAPPWGNPGEEEPPAPEVVGLLLPRSAALVASLLGCWWAGCAWLPLDPAAPAARTRQQLHDAGVRRVVALATQQQSVGAWDCELLLVPSRPDDCDPAPGLLPLPSEEPERLAYLIYTSGSSGRPRGVRVPQRGLRALWQAQVEAFQLQASSRMLWMLSPLFDASVSDVGTCLLAGATLIIDDTPLPEVLEKHAITHLDIPPALLGVHAPETFPDTLQVLIAGGEPSPPERLRAWAARYRLVSVYGPTETTVCSSLRVVDAHWDRPYLGAPIPGTWFVVLAPRPTAGEGDAPSAKGAGSQRAGVLAEASPSLSSWDSPLPPGVPGELCIGGKGVALGYLGDPERTAERFVRWRGQPVFRTGDRVVAQATDASTQDSKLPGNLDYVYLGRLDRQLKLRGLRIEPGEIEACLCEHPQVAGAVVVLTGEAEARQLVAAVEPHRIDRQGAAPPLASASMLRQWLQARLPAWMLPQRVVWMHELPRTPSGKVDAQAAASWLGTPEAVLGTSCDVTRTTLPEPTPPDGSQSRSDRPLGSPRPPGLPHDKPAAAPPESHDLEQLLCTWLAELLGLPRVAADQSLFDLGGDSFTVLRLVVRAGQAGIALAPGMVASAPSPRSLASQLAPSQRAHGRLQVDAPTQGVDVTVLLAEGRRLCQQRMREAPDPLHPRCAAGTTRPAPPSSTGGAILLTGGAGFLGARVLRLLLERTDAVVHALVRATSPEAAWQRLQRAQAWQELGDLPSERVRPLCGDVQQPWLGLAPATYHELAQAVGAIYHLAAVVDMQAPYDRLEAANVLSVLQLARLCLQGRPKALHHASSLSVFVSSDQDHGTLLESTPLEGLGHVYGGYAQTKVVAEVLLRSLPGQAWCYRLGLLTGDTQRGIASPHDVLALFARGLRAAGCVPAPCPPLSVDVTPVDWAASMLVALSLEAAAGTYHLASSQSLSLAALIASLRASGLELVDVPVAEMAARVGALAAATSSDPRAGGAGEGAPLASRVAQARGEAATALLALCRADPASFPSYRAMDLFQATAACFDTRQAQAALGPRWRPCPPPDAALLQAYWKAAGLTEA